MNASDLNSSNPADRLRAVLTHAARNGLPDPDISSISTLIQAGEWELALDTLCTQIYEYDVYVDAVLRSTLVGLGKELDVSVEYLLGNPWATGPDTVGS